jgi:hypothetical protein
MKFNSKTYHMKILSSSHKYKNSSKIFLHNKVYYNKLIIIIFARLPLQVNFNIFGTINVYTPNYMQQKLFTLRYWVLTSI